MAEGESALPARASTDGQGRAACIQQAHGISTNHGSVVLAGGNVSIRNYYQDQSRKLLNLIEALCLVPNLRKIHLDVLSKATPGTAIWILTTEYFLLWLDANGRLKVLWGTGIPGAGKSVMASVVINDLEARARASGGSICVAYLHFRYSDVTDLTLRAVLEILVKQTIERHSDCALLAEQVYAQHLNERTQPTQAELVQLLHQCTEIKSITFYVLDALDEAPEKLQVDIVRTLWSLNAKLFITSRPLKAVEAKISGVHSFTIVAQDEDLDLHIEREVSRSRDLEDLLGADLSFKAEVISSVKRNCGGMFLHAALQLEDICRCASAQDILDTLVEFPSDIKDVYHHTWNRIMKNTSRNVLLAKAVLVWVSNAARPMTIEELRHAIATHPGTHKFESKRMVSTATLLTLCCGLVTVQEETKLVRLIHYTAKTVIDKLLHGSFAHPHLLLSAVCITHLTECGFQDTKIESEEELTAALQGDPLLAYASEAWPTHARKILDLPDSRDTILSFVAKCKAFPSFTHPCRPGLFDVLTPLHILAMHSLPLSFADHGELGEPNILTRKWMKTPLMLACWFGNVDGVKAMLDLGDIQVNDADIDRWSALMHASDRDHSDVTRLLLAHPGVLINAIDSEGWSAIIFAAHEGGEGVAKALLSRPDIQVNLVNNKGWSALLLAARYGHEVIVEALLARPEIQVNLVNSEGWSALMMAACHGHGGIAEALLARPEIQVNLVDNQGWSALIMAARYGHEGISKALLARAEIQINFVNNEGWSALILAAVEGYEGIAKALLARPDNNGWSALIVAACHGHEGIAKALLARPEIQVNLVTNEGWSALMMATRYGHAGIATAILARHDIQVNLVDNEGWSALIMAARYGQKAIAEALLTRPDIQVNLVNIAGWSALMLAAQIGHEGVSKVILTHPDILVNLCDNDGWPAIILAANEGHEGVVKALLSHPDIQINAFDNSGWTALLVAAHFGHEGIVQLLLARPEAQVNLLRNTRGSALMQAATHGREGSVKLLLSHSDIQINLVDSDGFSALMHAATHNHKGIVKLLLERPEVQTHLATSDGETALSLATKHGYPSIVLLLSPSTLHGGGSHDFPRCLSSEDD